MFFQKKRDLAYFVKSFVIILGIVLVWRGVWYALDALDIYIFGENHIWTALGGIIVGMMLLYLPDKDFKEIEKL